MKKIQQKIPGVIVCTVIALISTKLVKFAPALGAAGFAIFLGMLLGNTVLDKKCYEEGSKFSETTLLAYSIVLMGGTLNINAVLGIGLKGTLFIIFQMVLTILITFHIGKLLGFTKKFSLLMCSGNAVCGSSAIAATAPVIKAEDKDKGIAVTIVNITGTILMFVIPMIVAGLYNNDVVKSSAMVGGIMQSVGQVIASAEFVSENVVELSTIFKIVRIIFLVFVVMDFARIVGKDTQNNEKGKVKAVVPWYIIGFFILCLLNSLIQLPLFISNIFKWISGNFEIIALAGIGMRVKFKDLLKEGPKAMLYGLSIGTSQVVIAIILIRFLIN